MSKANEDAWTKFFKIEASWSFLTGLGGLAASVVSQEANAPSWAVFLFLLVGVVAFVLFGAWLFRTLNPVATDRSGHMSPDERERLQEAFDRVTNRKCPTCGSSGWTFGNHYLTLPMYHSTTGTTHPEQFAPAFPAFCKSCGLICAMSPALLLRAADAREAAARGPEGG